MDAKTFFSALKDSVCDHDREKVPVCIISQHSELSDSVDALKKMLDEFDERGQILKKERDVAKKSLWGKIEDVLVEKGLITEKEKEDLSLTFGDGVMFKLVSKDD